MALLVRGVVTLVQVRLGPVVGEDIVGGCGLLCGRGQCVEVWLVVVRGRGGYGVISACPGSKEG